MSDSITNAFLMGQSGQIDPSMLPQQPPALTPDQQQQIQDDYDTSYAGDRADVDPNASLTKDGKRKPFYERQDFYNNLLNFGASTLAANAEPGMNAFGAIGKGVLGAVQANENERNAQATIRGQNVQQALEKENTRYRGAQLGLDQQKLNIIDRAINGLDDDSSPSTQVSSMDPQQQAQLPEAPLLTGISHVESGGDPTRENNAGYIGLYQTGTNALATAGMYTPAPGESLSQNQWKGTINIPGYGVMTKEQFLQNPGAQTVAQHGLMHANAQALNQMGVSKYIGQTMPDGTQITVPGVLAGAQLAGPAGVMRYLQTGKSPADGNGTTIPQYMQAVTQSMTNPATAQVVHDGQAAGGYQLLGGDAGTQQHVRNLQKRIAAMKMIGLGTEGYEQELNNIYATRRIGAKALADQNTHAVNTQYDVNNKPIATRNAVAIPVHDAAGNLTGYRYDKEPTPQENFDSATGMETHGFTETNPDGSTRYQPTTNVATEGAGLRAEDEETARISGKMREESVQKMDAAKTNLSTLQSYQDQLGNIKTGPGESYIAALRADTLGAMQSLGMTVTPEMEKQVSSAQNVSSLAGALNAHMFSSVHNVKNTVEFKSLQSAIPGLDNTPQSLQFILSHGQGESLEDMSESNFLQNAAQNQQQYPQFYKRGVFDANKALAYFHQKVSPMSYTYMVLNSTPQGQQMIHTMMSGDQKGITARLKAAQQSLQWLKSQNSLFTTQGTLDGQPQ